MADCAACSALSRERTTAALFRVREPSRFTATCGGWGSVPGELGRCPTDTDRFVRCDPVVRGPDVAPGVTSVEGYPPPMAFHRWASDGSAGLSRHVRASILRPTAAKAPRISRRMMIQVTGGSFFLLALPAWSSQHHGTRRAREGSGSTCRAGEAGPPVAARRAGLEESREKSPGSLTVRTRRSGTLACFASRSSHRWVELVIGSGCASPWSWSPSPTAGSTQRRRRSVQPAPRDRPAPHHRHRRPGSRRLPRRPVIR
jgi:hypothetical protein